MRLLAETATLADAVNRAARIAPMKGPEFFRAAGILFELRPGDFSGHELVLKATDLEVAYRQAVPVLEIDGEETVWRLPSALLSGILSTLPLGSGHTVELTTEPDNAVRIKAGRAKAKLRLLEADEFPVMPYAVDGDPLVVDGFAQLLAQVAWACASDKPPIAGVHIDGERLVALDGQKIAIVPCKIPVDAPITVPLAALSGLIKNTTQVGLIARDTRLYLLPDDETQASTVIYDAPYPNFERVLREDFEHTCEFVSGELEEAVSRMMVLVKTEKYPLVKLTIGWNTIGIQMDVPEIGLMEDEIDLSSSSMPPNSERFDIWFTPQNLIGAMNAARKPDVKFSYGPKATQSVSISDTSGYRCDVMPRHVLGGTP